LKIAIREIDIIGRWGGEEFLIVCPETDREGVIHLAQKLRYAIERHSFPVVKHKTASFGIGSYRQGDSISDLVSRSDAALYAAKRNGRNRVES